MLIKACIATLINIPLKHLNDKSNSHYDLRGGINNWLYYRDLSFFYELHLWVYFRFTIYWKLLSLFNRFGNTKILIARNKYLSEDYYYLTNQLSDQLKYSPQASGNAICLALECIWPEVLLISLLFLSKLHLKYGSWFYLSFLNVHWKHFFNHNQLDWNGGFRWIYLLQNTEIHL